MTQENVEIVQALLEKFQRGDHEGAFQHYDTAIEWDATRGRDHVPEIANLYRGHDGVRDYWRQWLAAWETMDFDYELIDAGENVVMAVNHQRNRGRSSGIEVEVPPYVLVFTMRNRKVTRWRFFSDQAEGRKAAGLSG